jgi:hypothetical protein
MPSSSVRRWTEGVMVVVVGARCWGEGAILSGLRLLLIISSSSWRAGRVLTKKKLLLAKGDARW